MICEKLDGCAFFAKYDQWEDKKLALEGFVKTYCKGDRQVSCIRKKISHELGGADKVPANMMPNGYPLPGTEKDEDWTREVIDLLKTLI